MTINFGFNTKIVTSLWAVVEVTVMGKTVTEKMRITTKIAEMVMAKAIICSHLKMQKISRTSGKI
ncbi:hypothetical protein SDC9_171795 [bioreactor metagenome]|uniref:Uncharacterized protein n=1 Tax=bioreactor metagenome TaxID=1076179 RepID=A0A645GBW1_9ZZZZ